MEHRARTIQSVGAAAVVFVGTEGVPFDWDGSDTGDVHVMTGVLAWKEYGQLEELVSTNGVLNATLSARPTPLLNPGFAALQWTLLAVFSLGVCVNLCATIFQFMRLKHAQPLTLGVLCLEFLCCCSTAVFLVPAPPRTSPRFPAWCRSSLIHAMRPYQGSL